MTVFMKHFYRYLLICGIYLGLFINQAYAYETTAHLKDVIKAFINSEITLGADESMEIYFDQLSSLVLPNCSNQIISSLPKDNNKQEITSVELTCSGVQPWHVFVPVHVAIYMKVLVAKQNILPEEAITADNVEVGVYDKNRLYNGYYKNSDDVIGQVASQLIQSGTVLTKKNIQAPIIIHRNQVVEVTATSNLVSVTMKGIAKSDGALNSTIKVLNTSSQKTFDAVVVGPNRAEVLL
jgi:flagella basal body P-ring formation protein FlgA